MKKNIALIILCFVFFFGNNSEGQTPFNRGVNLTNWFQSSNVRKIQFTKFTKQDLINIKSLGCDVIRLPINLNNFTDSVPAYKIDTLLFFFLDNVIDWAEELQIHLILDNHTFNPAVNTEPNIGDILCKVWPQMAERYKNRSKYIYFEILNEPHGISNALWNQAQQAVIDTIRKIDTKHTIVVGAANWNSYNDLDSIPFFSDTNLIYTFHFYDPFIFTHQGATWVSPSMKTLTGVPFPYNAQKMPPCPTPLKGTWIEDNLNNYYNDGTVAHVKTLIDIAANFKNSRNVPVYCGEFGVYIPNSNDTDRVYWYGIVRQYLEQKRISWTTWDYKGGFGLFEKNSNEMFDYDLNIPLIESLGLIVPPQSQWVLRPDSVGINIYSDYVGEKIEEYTWTTAGSVDIYHSSNTQHNGYFCIESAGFNRYNNITFNFKPDKDLSQLVSNGYYLDFWVRSNSTSANFDIRFLDTKTADTSDHPWRMKYTIDNSVAQWNGQWKHIAIPLSNMIDGGSWDNNKWYNPCGKFDWHAVDLLQIVSENNNQNGISVYFDDIKISDDISLNINVIPDKNKLQIVPNPFSSEAIIFYELAEKSRVQIEIFDVTGKKIKTLLNQEESFSGKYSVRWNGTTNLGSPVTKGIYFCRFSTDKTIILNKIIFIGN